jgi:hypothetical protein
MIQVLYTFRRKTLSEIRKSNESSKENQRTSSKGQWVASSFCSEIFQYCPVKERMPVHNECAPRNGEDRRRSKVGLLPLPWCVAYFHRMSHRLPLKQFNIHQPAKDRVVIECPAPPCWDETDDGIPPVSERAKVGAFMVTKP